MRAFSIALTIIALSTVVCSQGTQAQTASPSACPPDSMPATRQLIQLLSCRSGPQTLRVPEDVSVGTRLVTVARQLHLQAIDSSAGRANYLSYTDMALTLNQSVAALGSAGLTRQRFLCYENRADSSKELPLVVVFNLEVIALNDVPRLLELSPLRLSIWRHATAGSLLHIFRAKPPMGAEEAEMRFLLSSDAPYWLGLTAGSGQLTLAHELPSDSPSSLSVRIRVRDPLKCTESPEVVVDLKIFRLWRQAKLDLPISDICHLDNDTQLLDAVRQASLLESPVGRMSILWRGPHNQALVEAFSIKEAADSMEVRDVALIQFQFNCLSAGTTAQLNSYPQAEEDCRFVLTVLVCAAITAALSALAFLVGKYCRNHHPRIDEQQQELQAML